MKPVFGLDFGTTNSALSVLENGEVRVLNIGYNNLTNTLRSVLLFYKDEVFIGEEAVEQYLINHRVGRFMQSIKSILPSVNFGATKINTKLYEPEDLVAIILKTIKTRGELQLGQEVNDVVMGRPVIFSEDPRKDKIAEKRLVKAAIQAGFKNIEFQIEPIAAALAFEKTIQNNEEKIVVIGDFGGGTSDFSVIRLQGGSGARNRKKDILSVGGVYTAGEAFDSQIMFDKITPFFGRYAKYNVMGGAMIDMPKHIIYELSNRHTMYRLRSHKIRDFIRQIKSYSDDIQSIDNLEKIIDHDFGFLLFNEIENSKIRLTTSEFTNISFTNEYLQINESINLDEFNQLIKDDVKKIANCLDLTLKQSGLKPDKIDAVFTTGGTSQIKAIKKLFIDRFGKEKINEMDAFTSVAKGLGESAKYLFN